jgi:thiamine kinase-like enzyme
MYNTPPPGALPDIEAIARRIPLLADVSDLRLGPLQGVISLNNANYRVDADGKAYVLRIGAETARFLGIRREEELEAACAAAKAGVGPEVFYSDPAGIMLMPLIEGRHWEAEEFHSPANMARIARTLRRLHSVIDVAAQGSEYRRIERLLDSAVALGLELPSGTETYREKLTDIERQRIGDPRYVPGLAHNDLWANNFLDDGERLWLVDWEFSGTGDGMSDLATISMAGSYSGEEQCALLTEYGLTASEDFETLQTMKWVARFFEAAWALVQHGLRGSGSDTSGKQEDYNYLAYAFRMFERLSA